MKAFNVESCRGAEDMGGNAENYRGTKLRNATGSGKCDVPLGIEKNQNIRVWFPKGTLFLGLKKLSQVCVYVERKQPSFISKKIYFNCH